MELKSYQKKAVRELVEKTIELLSLKGDRHKLIFKSPTGSGKTVMASAMLAQLNTELEENVDVPVSQVAYIWVAPNKLHEQSYFKMKNYFTETREIRPVIYDEMDHSASGYIKPGEVLFVNWESINRDNALMIRETENSASLYDITQRTQEEQGIPIIVIIDEEHMFAGNLRTQTEKVLQKIQPKVEIRMSATPKTDGDESVTVHREKVIEEEMIKEGIVLNPAVNLSNSNEELNQKLISQALDKRNEIAEAYKDVGANINPLLLIQLPNDNEKMDTDDATIRIEIENYLAQIKDISTTNGRLAVWLSNETQNLDNIEKFDSTVDVLLFKQAIALGWDCPRAAVLLIFRKIESFTFSAQTVGRILRMPEQHYYEEECLNKGFVYTNLSKDIIEILQGDMGYISKPLDAKRRLGLNNILLKSEYFERLSSDRNRLVSDFKEHLAKTFVERWGVEFKQARTIVVSDEEITMEEESMEKTNILHSNNRQIVKEKIKFDVSNISIDIIKDLNITGEVGKTLAEAKATHVRTVHELTNIYNTFCAQLLGARFEKLSITSLAYALKEVLDALFGLDEADAIKVVLYDKNRPKFEDVINVALESYIKKRKTQRRTKEEKIQSYDWEVPAVRYYNESTHVVREDVKNHALMKFIELRQAWKPEKEFTKFLEDNTQYIDWWYKNGDSGKQHFSIAYENIKGEKSLFYVDFIIRMKNGSVYLFDTKTEESDRNAPAKHNALIDYINSEENKGKNLAGGILIRKGSNWKYSREKIDNTENITDWDSFYPC